MKHFTLILTLWAFAGMTIAQDCVPAKVRIPDKVFQNVKSKAYKDIIWSEDFNGDKWISTVKSDQNGYVFDPAATLPEGWTFYDTWEGYTTNPDYGYFHWSDVGPRGVYLTGNDDDPFIPSAEYLNGMPDSASIENGFMILESDFANTTETGGQAGEPKEMDSYIQFGPIDFSNNLGVIFNYKTLYVYCCSADASLALELSSNYNAEDNSGDWTVVPLNVLTDGNEWTARTERDMHINVSKYVGGKSSVFFRIRQTKAEDYMWVIDDITFYEAPENDIIVKDAWADYLYDATEANYAVAADASYNFWGGYTQIPQSIVGNFVQFRAAVEANGSVDAQNTTMNIEVSKDGSVVETFASAPKTIYSFTKDTLMTEVDYTPDAVGSYSLSMDVVFDGEDENIDDNSWTYDFNVTKDLRYSRVRHGMENDFDPAGPRDWANGGYDGDVCVQRFTFPESLETVRLKGIEVYIDNYDFNRDAEIQAIENSQFSMIARVYKYDADADERVDMGIASNLYTLKIEDTATWVALDFNDEGNLLVPADRYWVGIECYTGTTQELRFEIGKDDDAIKQPTGGGLVYFNGPNTGWGLTGSNYAIDLMLDGADVTFNVNMTNAGLVDGDVVYVTGNFADWNEPGSGNSLMLTDPDKDMIYTGSITVVNNFGELQYKYFKNTGWSGGEWAEETNRIISVTEADYVINPADKWGIPNTVTQNKLADVSMYPNPFNNTLTIENLENVAEIIVNNVLGQNVLTISVTENSMELSTESLDKGIYLITIVDANNNTRTKKVVKK